MNPRSIRFRLTAWYAAILTATLAAVGVGVWLAIQDSINHTVDKELRTELQSMRAFLQERGAGDAAIRELTENAGRGPVSMHFRIADARGRWLYQSPGTEAWGDALLSAAGLPKRGTVRAVVVKEGKPPLRVLSAAVPAGVVQIGAPTEEFVEMLNGFTWTALLASPILLILASAGGYWMSRRALASVERIARTAEEIEATNLSARLPLCGTGDELDHLSKTLNAMLGRLEDSFRRITQFTADASHELRTPVAIIRTTAEITRRKPRTEREYEEALDRILAESERTTELIEDLMLLARADAHRDETVLEPVSLAELAKSVCAEARVLAKAAGVSLTHNGLCDCIVSGDYKALHRLLLILLDNAIKYSHPHGEVEMQVCVCRRADRPMAMLEIRDNGIGISPEDLPHIFARFYRASKDRSRKIDGVGLGLSIAQWITDRHGGEIQVESKPGVGSTVRVFLPTM